MIFFLQFFDYSKFFFLEKFLTFRSAVIIYVLPYTPKLLSYIDTPVFKLWVRICVISCCSAFETLCFSLGEGLLFP